MVAKIATIQTIKKLIAKGAPYDPRGNSGKYALHAAISGKNLQLVKFFIQQGADVNSLTPDNDSMLLEAVLSGDPKIVHFLLEAGARPNDLGRDSSTPLIAAVAKRDLQIVRDLLRYSADPNKPSKDSLETPIIAAVLGDDVNLAQVNTLLDAGANANVRVIQTGASLLDYAKQHPNKRIRNQLVILLQKRGAK